MSMEHKAFVFDYEAYSRELRPVLLRSLEGDARPLDDFIDRHWPVLAHPFTAVPLNARWREELRDSDIKGAAALTKYYDTEANVGLGDDWPRVCDLLDRLLPSGGSITLGEPIEHNGKAFDPGRQGTYVQSPALVKANLDRLQSVPTQPGSNDEAIAAWREALIAASARGMYVTF